MQLHQQNGSLTLGEILLSHYTTIPHHDDGTTLIEVELGTSFNALTHHVKYQYDVMDYFGDPSEQEQKALNRILELKPLSILDLGAGSGRIACWITTKGQPGTNVTACEIDPGGACFCRQRGLTDVQEKSFEEINGTFDALLLTGGGIPMKEPAVDIPTALHQSLNQFKQKITPGGILYLGLSTYDTLIWNDEADYRCAKVRFDVNGKVSADSFYLYPSRKWLSTILGFKGFQLLEEWIKPVDEHGYTVSHFWDSVWIHRTK